MVALGVKLLPDFHEVINVCLVESHGICGAVLIKSVEDDGDEDVEHHKGANDCIRDEEDHCTKRRAACSWIMVMVMVAVMVTIMVSTKRRVAQTLGLRATARSRTSLGHLGEGKE